MKKLVFGQGVYTKGRWGTKNGRKNTKEYQLWVNMLQRCYSEEYHIRQPHYIGCTVSDNFKDFQYFAEWCNNQIGFEKQSWCLDKDLLFRGNKVYSEDTCVFLPKDINSLILQRKSKPDSPMGVSYNKKSKKYRAAIGMRSELVNLGTYSCPHEAHKIYRATKEMYVKEIAEEYKGEIDQRAYHSLISWTVQQTL